MSRPPLGFALAAAWTLAALLSFQLLAATVAALRPGAPLDVVAGCACQAAAFLLVLYGLLSVHAPDAPLPRALASREAPLLVVLLAIVAVFVWRRSRAPGAGVTSPRPGS